MVIDETSAHKIYYTKDGWLCNRYPYDLPIDDETRFLEVDFKTFHQTHSCANHFSWRVVDGKLTHERYEDTPEEEIIQELRDLREEICFPIINRGQPWHESLTAERKRELAKWYADWLDVTKTKKEPCTPAWLFSNQNEIKEAGNGTN